MKSQSPRYSAKVHKIAPAKDRLTHLFQFIENKRLSRRQLLHDSSADSLQYYRNTDRKTLAESRRSAQSGLLSHGLSATPQKHHAQQYRQIQDYHSFKRGLKLKLSRAQAKFNVAFYKERALRQPPAVAPELLHYHHHVAFAGKLLTKASARL